MCIRVALITSCFRVALITSCLLLIQIKHTHMKVADCAAFAWGKHYTYSPILHCTTTVTQHSEYDKRFTGSCMQLNSDLTPFMYISHSLLAFKETCYSSDIIVHVQDNGGYRKFTPTITMGKSVSAIIIISGTTN